MKHDETAILDHPCPPIPRWGRRRHWLLVGLGLGTFTWIALRVQNDHPPALQRRQAALRTSGADPVATELASKFEGAYRERDSAGSR